MGVGENATASEAHLRLIQINIPLHHGQAHFVETFVALVRYAYKVDHLDQELYKEVVGTLVSQFPTLNTTEEELDALDAASGYSSRLHTALGKSRSKSPNTQQGVDSQELDKALAKVTEDGLGATEPTGADGEVYVDNTPDEMDDVDELELTKNPVKELPGSVVSSDK